MVSLITHCCSAHTVCWHSLGQFMQGLGRWQMFLPQCWGSCRQQEVAQNLAAALLTQLVLTCIDCILAQVSHIQCH